jgi:hypothetical protein
MSERAGRRSRRSRTGEWKMTVSTALRSEAGLAPRLSLASARAAAHHASLRRNLRP